MADPSAASCSAGDGPSDAAAADPSMGVLVGVMRIRQRLMDEVTPLLRQHGLTESSYNALRILRGARPRGLRCQDVGERLLTRVPDVTRLVDRLERSALVERVRCPEDRRVCYVRILPAGLELLAKLDEPVDGLRRHCFGRLTTRDMRTLNRLLDKVLDAS